MTPPKNTFVFVDGDKYEWDKETITGAELRLLAGVPESAEIFQQVPGQPDIQVENDTTVNLEEHHGPARFSTQSPGSQAG